MPRYGLAVDHMTEHELWTRLEGKLSTLHLSSRNRDPLLDRILAIEQCQAIVRELRHRGEQLPLVPQHAVSDAYDASERAIQRWIDEGP